MLKVFIAPKAGTQKSLKMPIGVGTTSSRG